MAMLSARMGPRVREGSVDRYLCWIVDTRWQKRYHAEPNNGRAPLCEPVHFVTQSVRAMDTAVNNECWQCK